VSLVVGLPLGIWNVHKNVHPSVETKRLSSGKDDYGDCQLAVIVDRPPNVPYNAETQQVEVIKRRCPLIGRYFLCTA
jgi:hypothetical protein